MKNSIKKYTIAGTVLLFAAILSSSGVFSADDNGDQSKYLDFVLNKPDGKTFDFKSLKGKLVIVDFWDTWCPPCKKEIPGFISLKKKYKDKEFEIVGVALGQQGKDAVKGFAKEYKINYPVVIASKAILSTYPPFRGIPTTFVLNKKGEIIKKFTGYADEEEFEKIIGPLL